ncbi:MAG: hypothetical protein WCO58_02675 [bacterium]
MKNTIYLTILLVTIAVTGCRKKPTVITLPEKDKQLSGKEFPLWFAEGVNVNRFGLGYTQYGQSKWKISFKDSLAGLYYLPDTSVLDEDGNKLPGDQYISAQMIETYVDLGNGPVPVIRMNFPLPNQDVWVTQTRKVPTAWLSGDYTISHQYVDGQLGYLLVKVDGSNQIMLLDR